MNIEYELVTNLYFPLQIVLHFVHLVFETPDRLLQFVFSQGGLGIVHQHRVVFC